jgi:hypothetical protein
LLISTFINLCNLSKKDGTFSFSLKSNYLDFDVPFAFRASISQCALNPKRTMLNVIECFKTRSLTLNTLNKLKF